ncbi:MAG: ABC transporter ATP-binding protein [SAR202 cluster bacterium]|nr:ABC transporter [Chloroflexota bacterium]MQG51344.1 ABC transporter ATP-binding protein [SAR202 cluster bacterium]
MASAIKIENLTKYYGKFKALSSLNLEVNTNTIYAFIGPNGAGKTTTIRTLLGMLNPTEGTVSVLGQQPTQKNIGMFNKIGYLPGELSMYDKLTGNELLKFFGNLKKITDWNYVNELVERLNCEPTKKIKTLSKGNKQKFGLVLAFMHKPELLILDEPTSGLDPFLQQTTIELVQESKNNGATVFLSSHIFSEIDKVAETVGFIKEGELIVEEELEVLKSNAIKTIEIEFKSAPPTTLFDTMGNVQKIDSENSSIKLNVTGSLDSVIKEISKYEVLNIISEEPSLEDLFMNYYERK